MPVGLVLAVGSLARAQAPAPPEVVEGPPDASVAFDGDERALGALLEGDLAWREGRGEPAFDAWRAALVAASVAQDGGAGVLVAPPPFLGADPDGTLARRAEDARHAVQRRLAALGDDGRAAWRGRFEPLAEREIAAAGASPVALARVEREFLATRAAARAALILCDLAAERGEPLAAGAWASRAAGHAAHDDRALHAAIAARPSTAPFGGARGGPGLFDLELVAALDLGPTGEARDAAIPGLAFASAADGPAELATDVWLHARGQLVRLDAAGRAQRALDVRAALRAAGVETPPAFSEPAALWDERIATDGARVGLVAGRAREERGNALAVVEDGAAPRIAWARDSDGLVRDGLRVEGPAVAGGPALLEFQPGPLFVLDVLVVHVRAWPRDEAGNATLDEARSAAWCAAFDPRDGALRWARRLATGATARGRDRGRLTPAEPTSLPSPPPVATPDGLVAIDTGLGALALVDALDGRLAWTLRTARGAARASGAGGLATTQGVVWVAPAVAAEAQLALWASPDAAGAGLLAGAPELLGEARLPLGGDGRTRLAFAPGARGARLIREELAAGFVASSAELPFAALERGAVAGAAVAGGWIATAGGRAWILDDALRVRADLDLGPRAAFARCTALARPTLGADAIWVAGPARVALLRTR
ncbi:MAG: hypothetical protein JNK02_00750 [Planctomycetes bacterium]|nr:hypothetical protein [Planctomycetota bacterium]